MVALESSRNFVEIGTFRTQQYPQDQHLHLQKYPADLNVIMISEALL